ELQGLGDFAEDIATGAPAQVVSSPQVESLLNEIGISLGVSRSSGRLVPIDFDQVTRPGPAPHATFSLATAGSIFGTYERDVTSQVEPFPGWVFVNGTPADGFVFHFSEDDDFVIIENGAERHLSGEIRFLHVVYQTVGVDNVLTSVLMELAVDPIPVPVIHIPFNAVLPKGGTDYSRVDVGDVSQPNDLTNCYFGTLAFDFLHDESSAADIQTTLLAVDTTQDPDYVLLLDLDQLNVSKEIPEQVNVQFGFGHSDNATDPSVLVAAEFTDIVYDPKNDQTSASVTGTISHHEDLLATFAGSTNLVQLETDINGDGHVDAQDVCVDIDITFTDNHETQNLCVALQGLAGSLPFLPEGTGTSLRFGPLTF
ncbi:MAG TPA: hypothetical protein VNM87_09160, partial [Candidatus Udaeobacter sp.]|nr:hypothetical protein [Candidatus Udaeobacter sp.]